MYHGDYETKHLKRRRRRKSKKTGALFLSLLLIAVVAAGGTLAWLSAKTDEVKNTFIPGEVTTEVTEKFDGTTKSKVNVINTGNVDAYVRVKLVTYRVNEDGEHIGGKAEIPYFAPGEDWVQYTDGYYYYTKPVAPGSQPEADLISSITLEDEYDDPDGGKQVIEVMAEAIQSVPAEAAGEAWGVTISPGQVTEYHQPQGGAGE